MIWFGYLRLGIKLEIRIEITTPLLGVPLCKIMSNKR
jgi:hypothetical protein